MKVLEDPGLAGKAKQNKLNLDLLKRSIEKDTLSHAYLFLGNDMEKLYRLALALSAAVSCEHGGCGICDVCKNTLKGLHSDVSIIEAEGPILTKDKITQLQMYLNRSSYGKKRKICIIKEAETMNQAAANKLLKTLEEPPGSSNLIILLAEDGSRLLPTIISRCLVFTWDFDLFGSVKEFDFQDLTKTVLEGLAGMFGSQSLTKPVDLSADILERLSKTLNSIRKKRAEDIKKFEDIGLDTKDTKRSVDNIKHRYKRLGDRANNLGMNCVFDIISGWLEDILAVKAGASADALNYRDYYNIIKANSNKISTGDIYGLLDDIDRNKRFLKFSINNEISLDAILLGLQHIRQEVR